MKRYRATVLAVVEFEAGDWSGAGDRADEVRDAVAATLEGNIDVDAVEEADVVKLEVYP